VEELQAPPGAGDRVVAVPWALLRVRGDPEQKAQLQLRSKWRWLRDSVTVHSLTSRLLYPGGIGASSTVPESGGSGVAANLELPEPGLICLKKGALLYEGLGKRMCCFADTLTVLIFFVGMPLVLWNASSRNTS
jgi:hypothetical protein